jgi:adenylosuccinate lyase
MLRRFTRIVKGLLVNADRMRQNLELSRGVVFSGTVLLELAQRGVSREKAYEWVQRNALRSYDEQKDFQQLLLADGDVMGVLDARVIADAFDLKVQLKNVDKVFDRVFRPAAIAAGSRT